jgi:hypothetical protein
VPIGHKASHQTGLGEVGNVRLIISIYSHRNCGVESRGGRILNVDSALFLEISNRAEELDFILIGERSEDGDNGPIKLTG